MCTSKCHLIIDIQSKDFLTHKLTMVVQAKGTVPPVAQTTARTAVLTISFEQLCSRTEAWNTVNFTKVAAIAEDTFSVQRITSKTLQDDLFQKIRVSWCVVVIYREDGLRSDTLNLSSCKT